MDAAGVMYREGRQRLAGLAAALTDDDAAAPVPACPGWRARDVIAHLAGVCTDSLAGNLDGVTTAAVDFLVGQGLHRTLVAKDLGPLAIRAPTGRGSWARRTPLQPRC